MHVCTFALFSISSIAIEFLDGSAKKAQLSPNPPSAVFALNFLPCRRVLGRVGEESAPHPLCGFFVGVDDFITECLHVGWVYTLVGWLLGAPVI